MGRATTAGVPDELRRRLGVFDAVVIGLGSMIGAGVFAALAPAARAAGSGLLPGLAVAAVVAYCNATSSARLAARYPASGGTYVYGRERLGAFWGYLAGWGFVVGKTASCAAMALTVGSYVWPAQAHAVAVGAVVALAFLIAVVLWAVTAINRVKRAFSRGTALVTTALNTLSHGVVIVSRQDKVVFCNNRYLEIYGLARADVMPGITGAELIALRRSRGIPEVAGPGGSYAVDANGMVIELINGRSILMKRYVLPNGNAVATYEDCTEQRSLAKQLASANSFLESIIDNVPVCIAAKSVEDGRYIFANRAFERFSRFSRDHIVGKRADEIFRPETADNIEAADRAALEAPSGHHRSELLVEASRREAERWRGSASCRASSFSARSDSRS